MLPCRLQVEREISFQNPLGQQKRGNDNFPAKANYIIEAGMSSIGVPSADYTVERSYRYSEVVYGDRG